MFFIFNITGFKNLDDFDFITDNIFFIIQSNHTTDKYALLGGNLETIFVIQSECTNIFTLIILKQFTEVFVAFKTVINRELSLIDDEYLKCKVLL